LHQLILLTQGPIHEILAKSAQLLVVVEKLSFFELDKLKKFQNFYFFRFKSIQISHSLWDTKDGMKF
jgi:hypothetical protein